MSRIWILALIGFLGSVNSAQAGEKLFFVGETVNPLAIQTEVAGDAKSTRYFIVQFKNRITPEDRQSLTALGAHVVRYLPDDAYVVQTTESVAQAIPQTSNDVRSVIPFHAKWKMSPTFEPANVFSASNELDLHIRLFPGVKAASIVTQLGEIREVQVLSAKDSVITAHATRGSAEAISLIDGVEWIQPKPTFQLLSFDARAADGAVTPQPAAAGDYTDLTGYESGTKVMNFQAAYARGFTGKGQIAGMADTGVDTGDNATIHQDFTGRIDQGFIFGLFSKSWEDPMGHGTHVAGSILGSGKASGNRVVGGAYEAHLVAESMWSPMLDNLSVPEKMSELFDKAYGAGARVHSNSWGSAAVGAYDSFAEQVDEFSFAHPDMLIVFAAGNAGVDLDKDGRIDPNSIGSPATAKNVLTVGASKNLILNGGIQKQLKDLRNGATNWGVEPLASSKLSENAGGMACFSSRGPTADGRTKPEIVAPGTNIMSVHSSVKDADPLWGLYNNDYAWSGGTSMATPLVAGAATVLRQYLVEDRKIANPSSALMKAVLMHTAFDLYPGEFGEIGAAKGQEIVTHRPNNDEGYGRVDMDHATNLKDAVLLDDSVGLATGESHSYPVKVSASSHLTATLVYTDAPGSETAAKSLVNDLDLVVVQTSTGKETTLNDHTNNSEMVEMPVDAGDYSVVVKGTNVPQGMSASSKQPYALVISVQ